MASTLPFGDRSARAAVSRSSAVIWAPPKLSPLPRPTVAVIVPANVPTSVRYEIGVADGEVLRVGGGLVDGDLVGALRGSALLDGHALEAVLALPRHAERRSTGRVAMASPSRVDELGEPVQDRFHDGDALDVANRVGEPTSIGSRASSLENS